MIKITQEKKNSTQSIKPMKIKKNLSKSLTHNPGKLCMYRGRRPTPEGGVEGPKIRGGLWEQTFPQHKPLKVFYLDDQRSACD
jgi:hypothetical protein